LREYNISIVPGEVIGPELTAALLRVLDIAEHKWHLKLLKTMVEAGDIALKKLGEALPRESLDKITGSDVCIKGPVGETAAEVIVKLRQTLNLYANVRPSRSFPNIGSLKPNVDLVIVRENTEDLYKGIEYELPEGTSFGIRIITDRASVRIARYAFKLAEKRRKKVTSVHKANVLKVTCGTFAKACRRVSEEFPNVEFNEQYVDACSANLIRIPEDFDVIVTTNLFGDILSDEAAQVAGGLGLAPTGNIGDEFAIFEPVHGAAFDIAGKQIANPTSIILSASMMFEWLGERFDDPDLLKSSEGIRKGIESALSEAKYLTRDLGGESSTTKFSERVCQLMGDQ
jgi:3-isopropylmalate dehydrogenase